MSVIDLGELQRQVGEWQKRELRPNGEEPHILKDSGKVCEEAGELMGAVIKSLEYCRNDGIEWGVNVLKELGDVVIACCGFAENHNVDLASVVLSRWQIVGAGKFATKESNV